MQRFPSFLVKIAGFLILMAGLPGTPAIASGVGTDSLLPCIRNCGNDSRCISDYYAERAFATLERQPDSALRYAGIGLTYARNPLYKNGLAACYLVLGDLALRNNRLEQAKIYLETAAHFITPDTKPIVRMNIWNDLGYLCDIRSSYGEAMTWYYRALEVAEKTGNRKWTANLTNNIAVIYDLAGYSQKSLDLYRKAGAIFLDIQDSAYYANSLINQGYVYSSLKRPDSAEFYFRQALPLNLTLENHYGLASLYLGLGIVKLENGRCAEAKSDLDSSLSMIDDLVPADWGARSDIIAEVWLNQGLVAFREGRYAQSLELLRKVRQEAGKLDLLSVEHQAIQGLSSVFAGMRTFDSAYLYSALDRQYKDSLANRENRQQVAVSEYIFRSEIERINEKARQESLLAAHNRRILFLAACVAGILMLSVILLLLYLLQRSKLHRLQLQRENLASDKSSLELEIKHKNRELVASSMSQIQSGEILKEVSNRLADAVEHNPSPADEELQQIILKLKQPSSGPFWHEFDRYFVEVGDNFYALLTSRYPNLSPGEVRLCALLKLNLSTKEIASITKKSEHSIKIARYRLRSKLKLTRAVNIHSFLNGL